MRINLFHMLWIILSVFIANNNINAQCDLAITEWDGTNITIEAINSDSCGCSTLFTSQGTNCFDSSNPHTNNNTSVSHLVFGLHVESYDYNWGCINTANHAGWVFKVATLYGNTQLSTGDTWTGNVFDYNSSNNDCWSEILSNDTLCSEIVIWQINLSQTSHIMDGGWALSLSATNTQNYPDVDVTNNRATYCAPEACDTVYTIEYVDVVEYVDVIEYVYDTTYVNTITYVNVIEYVDVIEYDTTYITNIEYAYDTMYIDVIEYVNVIEYIQVIEYVDVIVDNFVYVTDTLTMTEYVLQFIDCETGEDCEIGVVDDCLDHSIFVPNTFTPNNDGVNDTFYVVTDSGCWNTWSMQVFNRWGNLVWESNIPSAYWQGQSQSGNYFVPDGVYVWKIRATRDGGATEIQGNISVFR